MRKTRATRKARFSVSVEGAGAGRHAVNLAERLRTASKAFGVAHVRPHLSTEGTSGVVIVDISTRAAPKFAATITDWARQRQNVKITIFDSEGVTVANELGTAEPTHVEERLVNAFSTHRLSPGRGNFAATSGPHGPGDGPDDFVANGPKGLGDPPDDPDE